MQIELVGTMTARHVATTAIENALCRRSSVGDGGEYASNALMVARYLDMFGLHSYTTAIREKNTADVNTLSYTAVSVDENVEHQ